MKKALLLFFTAICIQFVGAQTISGNINASDPKFHRPANGMPPTALSIVGTNVSYNLIPYVVTVPGLLTIVCTGSVNFDTFGFLYSPAGFNPLTPLANVLVGDDDSGPGVNFAITYNFPAAGTYYIVVTTLKNGSFGNYSLNTSQGGPLPVRLVSFSAEKTTGGKNLLKWTSAEEINILKYQLQHSSEGNKFTDVPGASINAKNGVGITSYNFTDNISFATFNYYRLKIIDKSGLVTLSNVAVVNNGNSRLLGYITIFPNPAVNYLNIQTKAGQKGKAAVSITSAGGQIVYKADYTIANESIVNLDVKKLPSGNYYVRINSADGTTTTLPFVKH